MSSSDELDTVSGHFLLQARLASSAHIILLVQVTERSLSLSSTDIINNNLTGKLIDEEETTYFIDRGSAVCGS